MTSKNPKSHTKKSEQKTITQFGEVSGFIPDKYLPNRIIQDTPDVLKAVKRPAESIEVSRSTRRARILAWLERDSHSAIPAAGRTLFEITSEDGRSLVAVEEK